MKGRLKNLRAVVLDVDGVLTDAGMYYGPEGEAFKKFNSRDGMGVRLLRAAGLEVALITGENSQAVARRAEKLKIEEVHLGIEDKLPVLQDLAKRKGYAAEEIGYMGDDVNDLACLQWVGVAAAPADAMPPVLSVAELITERNGGEGAVREFADQILSSRV